MKNTAMTRSSKNVKWPKVRFGDVVRLSKARSQDPLGDGFDRYVGLEHLEPGDLRIRSWGNVVDGVTFTSVFQPGQVLFGKRRAYQRKVAVADFVGVCSGDIYVLEAKDTQVILPELLPFICQTDAFFDHAVGTSAGSLSPRTNWTSLADFEFALPPLEEQKRLVILFEAIAVVEEELRTTEHEVDRLQKAAMQDLLDADLKKWEKRPIGEAFKVTTGGTPSRSNATFWNGDVPWVKTGEVNYYVIQSTEEHITAEGLKGSAAKLCPPGSVLVALYGQGPTRGRVGMLGIQAAVNQACAAIYPNPDFDPWFVFYYLSGKYLSLRAMAQGAAQPNLNLAMIKAFDIPVPPLEEQQSAVASIDAIAKAKAEILQRREQTAEIKRKLREETIGNVIY
ncbi:restriction endonuclease subunit S [Noviherbaspirillum pedocola]|uniref:Restriction endonuclease subunit S n=1 Tax=Noviherbaspirillum pedocola TaxID=2801341 RepID=A0A934W4W8_9BURK|nr:restriction endonuclease subunit S [Noviherbaspirillum pedocola]MBK4738986.1 restriction endonuclease subunit S [Noviherbaspirillum pedocola]